MGQYDPPNQLPYIMKKQVNRGRSSKRCTTGRPVALEGHLHRQPLAINRRV